MAKSRVVFAELFDQAAKEKILLSAKQNGGFRVAVDSAIKRTAGARSKSIAQGHVVEAVEGIKDVLQNGITSPTGSIHLSGIHIGDVRYSYSWDQLANVTIKRKIKQDSPGKNKLWLDTGDIRKISASMAPPTVKVKTKAVGLDSRRANKKDPERIDFEVELTFGNMNFPFDQLVRRPLITGDINVDVPDLDPEDGGSIFYYMEYGVTGSGRTRSTNVPARPWVRGVSAAVGDRMFFNLTNQT